VVEAYNLLAWNNRDLALAAQLLADTGVRHDAGNVQTLTRSQAMQGIADTWKLFTTSRFELNLVVAGDDGQYVAVVYQGTGTLKGRSDVRVGAIEVYSCGHQQGVWA